LKKIIFMRGVEGGPVYWRVIGTKGSKETETSDVRMIWVGGAQEVGSPEISPTQKSSLQTLSWENKCNKKFKVWFGSDGSFTKKKALSFNVADPTEDNFTKQLTSSQWTGIRKLVGDVSGSTISWKVESWDGMNRHAETDVMSFVLTDYPMCEGTEGGLDAIYSNGRQAFEGPINHGWGTSCPSDPPYEHNLYQGICTPPSASPVDWAKGGWNGSSDPTGFSVSWNGYLFAPVDGAYSFGGWVDGIVYVEINGEVVANMNTIGSSYGGTVTLQGGGCVPISMSFSTNGGSNNMILNWRPPGASVSELVPRTYLRHDVGP
jgi:hypothetical protein